jgi:hypothetical protein
MVVAVAACRNRHTGEQPVTFAWHEVTLPALASGEHAAVRAATACGGRWYLTGAIIAADGTPRPAAWLSTDATTWKSMTLEPNTFYGRLNTLYAAACRFGFLAAIGAKTGGVHGFPRTSNWFERADGMVHQIEAPYTLYGGPDGVNLSRIVGGPSAWVETGNRTGGAAVWTSPDAESYHIIENVPGLANDEHARNWSNDVVSTPDGWMLVGSITLAGQINSDPSAWVSTDAQNWSRVEVPASPQFEEMQRATFANGDVVGIGLSGGAFGTWRHNGTTWRSLNTFGASGGPGHGFAAALAAAAGQLVAATSDGSSYALWQSTDTGSSWHPVSAPVVAPAGYGKATLVASDGKQIVLVIDNGTATRVWLAP